MFGKWIVSSGMCVACLGLASAQPARNVAPADKVFGVTSDAPLNKLNERPGLRGLADATEGRGYHGPATAAKNLAAPAGHRDQSLFKMAADDKINKLQESISNRNLALEPNNRAVLPPANVLKERNLSGN